MTSGVGNNAVARRKHAQEPPSDPGSLYLHDSRAAMFKCSCSCRTGRPGRFKRIGRCAKVVKVLTPASVHLVACLAVAYSIEKPNTAMPFPWCVALLASLLVVEAYSVFLAGNFDEPVGRGGCGPTPRTGLGMSRSVSVLRSPITTVAAAGEFVCSLAASIISTAVGCCRCRMSDLKGREGRTLYRRDRVWCASSTLEDSNGGVGGNVDMKQSTTSWKTMTSAAAARGGVVASGGGTGSHGLKPSGLWCILCTAFAAFAVADVGIASGQGDDDQGWSVVTVPLKHAGFQYTVDVRVSGANYDANAALVVDSALHIVGFPSCSGDSEDEGYEGEDDLRCIPSEAADLGENSTYLCQQLERDDGTVFLQGDSFQGLLPPVFELPETSGLRYLSDQHVALLNSSLKASNTSSFTPSADGSVFLISNQTSHADRTLQGWNSTGGVLGLAPYSHPLCVNSGRPNSVFSRILENLTDSLEPMFALNLNDEDSESTLEIGGHTASSHAGWGELLWGERHTATFPSGWGFSAFDLSVCGRNLMDNVTSSWPAILSTGSACLGLPQQMFDGLVSWLPCRVVGNRGTHHQRVCYIDQNTASSELPWLSFRLSERGTPLYIPLGLLLLSEGPSNDPDSTDRRLCVTRGSSILEEDHSFKLPNFQPVITLGTLALRSLYAVMDAEMNRVGLSQKALNMGPQDHNETCQAPTVCVGMQTFKESSNSCEDPSCSTYFFASLDEGTMSCRSSVSLSLLGWTVGIVIGVMEMALHFLRAYYGGTGVALRGRRQSHDWEFHIGRIIDTGVGKAVRALGLSPPRRDN